MTLPRLAWIPLLSLLACGARSQLEILEEEPAPAPTVTPEPPAPPPEEPPPPEPPEPPPPPVPPECAGPDTTYVYVVTSSNDLYAFKPQSEAFELRGRLECPVENGATPFSMAVSRDAIARVLYNDGTLWEVALEDASCEATSYVPAPPGDDFHLFGMGYAANQDDDGESLYVADIDFGTVSAGLARIDTETYERTFIGPFSANPGTAIELTPTGADGPLYGFFINEPPPGGTLVEIDTDTAEIVDAAYVNVASGSGSLAVAWWGGDFYVFYGQNGATSVNRYDPETQETTVVATLGDPVVGAGVSTCAPEALP